MGASGIDAAFHLIAPEDTAGDLQLRDRGEGVVGGVEEVVLGLVVLEHAVADSSDTHSGDPGTQFEDVLATGMIDHGRIRHLEGAVFPLHAGNVVGLIVLKVASGQHEGGSASVNRTGVFVCRVAFEAATGQRYLAVDGVDRPAQVTRHIFTEDTVDGAEGAEGVVERSSVCGSAVLKHQVLEGDHATGGLDHSMRLSTVENGQWNAVGVNSTAQGDAFAIKINDDSFGIGFARQKNDVPGDSGIDRVVD